ncbi:peptidase [Candidatus Liberibacter brunswickensis]
MYFISSIITVLTTIPSQVLSISAKVNQLDVLQHYANIAHAKFEDSVLCARILDSAIEDLISNPSKKNLQKARLQWIKARIPYQQSEVYRFGSKIIDILDKKVNSWPLDEGFIDYVDSSYGKENEDNNLYTANIIANSKILVKGQEIDTSVISIDLLRKLNRANGIDTNITTGYHVIEFLLWGQDLQTKSRESGTRPYTDFDIKNCTGNHCKRRIEYLKYASKILISDLEEMMKAWESNGEATKNLMQDTDAGLNSIITGMTHLSYNELAGERMNLSLILHDPEQEIDGFSDNTHSSYLNNVIGIISSYTGEYIRINGEKINGPSLRDLINYSNKNLDNEIQHKFSNTIRDFYVLKNRAENFEYYDQMIGDNNPEGNQVVRNIINDLITQTESLRKLRIALDLKETNMP